MKLYYLDTCIWLNLFKKEGDASKGVPYWELAEKFIDTAILSKDEKIIYSKIVVRELQIFLENKDFIINRKKLESEPRLEEVQITKEDKVNARKLESEYNFEISFYDLIHLSISKRLNAILVTRDKDLLEIASENGVIAKRPEEL